MQSAKADQTGKSGKKSLCWVNRHFCCLYMYIKADCLCRLFDSQNNQRGGYNVGPQPMYYYTGSKLQLEW